MRYWRQPLDAVRVSAPRGDVIIVEDRCKGCAFCVEYCPLDVLILSESFNRKGYHPPEIVKHGLCVDCGLCEMICPEFAIFSVAIPQAAQSATGNEEATP